MQNRSLYQAELEAGRKHKEECSKQWADETRRFINSRQWRLAKKEFFRYFEKKCANCGSIENIHLDHIYPRVKDNKGTRWLDITNLQPLCETCNCTIKGTKSTDYREYKDQRRALDVKHLYESEFRRKELSTKWVMWEDKKKAELRELGDEQTNSRNQWKSKLKKCVQLKMSYGEIIKHFDITPATPDHKYVENYLTYLFSDNFTLAKEKKKERKNRSEFKRKRKDKAWILLTELYEKRNELSKEQFIESIESMVEGINQ